MKCSPEFLSKIDKDLVSRDEDTRWQAAIALGEFIESESEKIWPLVLKHGSRRHADTRAAIATCVLEHILEHHFDAFFPRVADAARDNRWFRDTFLSCWKMGLPEDSLNAKRWNQLREELHKIDARR